MNGGDKYLIVTALRETAAARLREAGGRKWAGPQWAGARKQLRENASRMLDLAGQMTAHVAGYMSAQDGTWHRAAVTEPTFTRDESTACGLTFRPLNVTWHGEKPPTTSAHMCRRPGCRNASV